MKINCLLPVSILMCVSIGCIKSVRPPFTNPIIKAVNPATRVIAKVLADSVWQAAEVRALENNVPYYYLRGQVNSWNLDQEYVLFKTDFSGTYGDANGNAYPMTWSFADTGKVSVQFIIQYPTPLTVNWENMIYTDSRLYFTQYFVRPDGTEDLASGYRTSKY